MRALKGARNISHPSLIVGVHKVTVSEARNHFWKVLRLVRRKERRVVILDPRSGEPLAELLPCSEPSQSKDPGTEDPELSRPQASVREVSMTRDQSPQAAQSESEHLRSVLQKLDPAWSGNIPRMGAPVKIRSLEEGKALGIVLTDFTATQKKTK